MIAPLTAVVVRCGVVRSCARAALPPVCADALFVTCGMMTKHETAATAVILRIPARTARPEMSIIVVPVTCSDAADNAPF